MSRRVKLQSKAGRAGPDLAAESFAELDEMRAHVDRHSRDPERRRARLTQAPPSLPTAGS